MSANIRSHDLFLSTNERTFITESLKETKQRIDGRGLYDMRLIKISFGNEQGYAEVQLGTTRVIAITTCEIVTPYDDHPTEGFFTFNTEFSPMADPNFEIGRPSEYAIELGRIVERGLRESRAVDTEALCIIAGQKVWSIRCDIHIVDNGGNLIDCASIAVISALLHFRRPSITVQGQEVIVHSPEDHESVPLSIHHIPISITFGFFGEEDDLLCIIDPQLKEELVMAGRMTVTLNSHRELCAVQKAGGAGLSVEQILQCTRIAAVKVEEINELINTSIKQQASKKRKAGVSDTVLGLPSTLGIELQVRSTSTKSKANERLLQDIEASASQTNIGSTGTKEETSKNEEDESVPSTVIEKHIKTSANISYPVSSSAPKSIDLSIAVKKKAAKRTSQTNQK